jgi:hypothetical protein
MGGSPGLQSLQLPTNMTSWVFAGNLGPFSDPAGIGLCASPERKTGILQGFGKCLKTKTDLWVIERTSVRGAGSFRTRGNSGWDSLWPLGPAIRIEHVFYWQVFLKHALNTEY